MPTALRRDSWAFLREVRARDAVAVLSRGPDGEDVCGQRVSPEASGSRETWVRLRLRFVAALRLELKGLIQDAVAAFLLCTDPEPLPDE